MAVPYTELDASPHPGESSHPMAQREVQPAEVAAAKREALQLLLEAGFLYARVLPDGRCLYLAPAPIDRPTILLGLARNIGSHGYYAVWEYAPGQDAMWSAALGWDGNGEPEGFRYRTIIPGTPAVQP